MTLFDVNEKSSIPVWLQLKNRFIYLITSGYYKPGDKLPTVRGLAADIEVNYNTISKVYMSLEQDGYIESKRRQGAFVRDVSDKPGVSIQATAEIVTKEYLKRCHELGMTLEDIEKQVAISIQEAKATRDRVVPIPGANGEGEVGVTPSAAPSATAAPKLPDSVTILRGGKQSANVG